MWRAASRACAKTGNRIAPRIGQQRQGSATIARIRRAGGFFLPRDEPGGSHAGGGIDICHSVSLRPLRATVVDDLRGANAVEVVECSDVAWLDGEALTIRELCPVRNTYLG